MKSLLIFAVLASTAAAAAPEPLPDLSRLAALIKQLDADDFRSRDRATRELRDIGLPALEALKQAAASATSAEARERADRLARAIRLSTIEGGPAFEGMRATLRSDRETFAAGQPIAFQLEIKNETAPNLEVPPALSWSAGYSYGPAAYWVRNRSTPSHAELRIHQLSGVKPVTKRGPISCGTVGRSTLTPLKVGQTAVYEVPVTMLGTLVPGEYEVRISVHTWTFLKDPKGPLESNTVRFSVE
jgi:hypothetical protein